MIRLLFLLCFFPLLLALRGVFALLLWLRIRRAGVLELVLDHSRLQKNPLWMRGLEQAIVLCNIRAVHLRIRPAKRGWATLQELRGGLGRISESGVPILVTLESADTESLYLASVCDEVYLAPLGDLMFSGVAMELVFLGEALERFGVEFEVVSAGEYKSAAEPLSRSYASPANRRALKTLVTDLHTQVRKAIAEGRNLDEAEVQVWMDKGIVSAADALEAGLVDGVMYEHAIEECLKRRLGKSGRVIKTKRLERSFRMLRRLTPVWRRKSRIHVLHLEGAIMRDGPRFSRKTRITQEESLAAIEALIDSPPDGVVLYINSPGGSALVSDIIWEAMERLVAKVPVVACFGNVSASGGYYVAAGCREIVAQPLGLTGSIGVISGKLVLGEALARLGVHVERVAGAEGGEVLSTTRPLTEIQRKHLKDRVREIYAEFKGRVGAGRGMDSDAVEAVAQGRVWSGSQAHAEGLVDHLGGIDCAIERVCVLAEISPKRAAIHYQLVEKAKPFWARMLGGDAQAFVSRVEGMVGTEVLVIASHPREPLAMWPVEMRQD